ncbi:MAG: trypsin-like peptidase domain-containing protein [Planctomycetes bacterium]|nr:trypsin-like peptidase domain-containing protein [Planctomycetota bacterium]
MARVRRHGHRVFWGALVVTALALAVLGLSVGVAAETRTWTVANGGYQTEAEFIELRDGKTVRLKLKDGAIRDVPLELLVDADKQFVQKHAAPTPLPPVKVATAVPKTLTALQAAVARTPSAVEALKLYRAFRESADTSDDDRKATDKDFAEMGKLAATQSMRTKDGWEPGDKYAVRHTKAIALTRQGIDHFTRRQDEDFRKRFAEAAALEPENTRIEFLTGAMYARNNRDLAKAEQHFKAVVARDPGHVAALNNLALLAVRNGEYLEAVKLWRTALESEPNQDVVQNLGRFVDQFDKARISCEQFPVDEARKALAAALATGRYEACNPRVGWLTMMADDDMNRLINGLTTKADLALQMAALPQPADDSTAIHGGLGVIVGPRLVVTSKQLVDGGTAFDVYSGPSDQRRTSRGTLLGVSKTHDLALLSCDDLNLTGLSIEPAPASRGTELFAGGMAEMFYMHAPLRLKHGAVAAVSGEGNSPFLFDALTNQGFAGGAIVNQSGNVLGLVSEPAGVWPRFTDGVPGAAIIEFVKSLVPEFIPPKPKTETLDAADLQKRVGDATVLVWTWSNNATRPPAAMANSGFEDRDCATCRGTGELPCPIKDCKKGKVNLKTAGGNVQAPCPVCNGKSHITCPTCQGNRVDPDWRRPDGYTISAFLTQVEENAPKSTATYDVMKSPRHDPITPQLSSYLVEANLANRIFMSQSFGGGGEDAYRNVCPDGALLIGLDIGLGRNNKQSTVAGVRGIFATKEGVVLGPWNGQGTTGTDRLEAKPGYAVGGIKMRSSNGVDGLALMFMRIHGTRLDVTDMYLSKYVGGTGGSDQQTIGCDGNLVVGIYGRNPTDPKSVSNTLGLIVVPPLP